MLRIRNFSAAGKEVRVVEVRPRIEIGLIGRRRRVAHPADLDAGQLGRGITSRPDGGIARNDELAEMLGVSVGHAYKLIRKLNQELEKEGFLVIAGKVPRRYFEKRWYGFSV